MLDGNAKMRINYKNVHNNLCAQLSRINFYTLGIHSIKQLLSDMTHKQSNTHTTTQSYTLMRSIQDITTETNDKCGYSPNVLYLKLMYCRVQ